MSEIVHINMDTARFDPEKEFGTPDKLVACVAMTRGQKIASLQRWSAQVLERFKASGEGMPTNRTTGADLELLEQIKDALDTLKEP